MSKGDFTFGMVMFLLPVCVVAIWTLDSKIKKLERRIDELSDILSKRFNIEI